MRYLSPLIDGKTGFRFSDLSHYSRMENEAMRDEELVKMFTVGKSSYELKINGRVIDPANMTSDPIFSFPARHCFCLCLSNCRDSNDLYAKFQADVCIEVKVNLYLEFLENMFKQQFQGMQVIAKDIIYFDNGCLPETSDPNDLVFYKPSAFAHENEFRIALFYPENKRDFKAEEGDTIPFYKEDESNHLTISYLNPDVLKQFIGKVYKPTHNK